MPKNTAKESLGRLRSGIARDTPASRAAGDPAASGNVSDGLSTDAMSGTEKRVQAAERKVRVSVDLPRSEHKYLRDFAYDAESDAMRVMRALLQEMQEDEELAVRVQQRLASNG